MFKIIERILKNIDPTKLLFFGYLSYIIFGWILLCLPFTSRIDTKSIDDLFITVSAISTTGLTTITVSENYNFFGQLVILILIQMGGLGYMSFGSFIILSTKKEISEVRKSVLQTGFSLPKHFDILKFVKSIVVYTFVIELLGAIALYFYFKR